MNLQVLWFVLIAVLWTGFFVLEGFDFGVGMLHGIVGKTEAERRLAINSIGPLWDGNEVWLIVAGAGMFAAFPGWYATMFSGLYLALVLLLAALIFRGVSFEFRGKRDSAKWRRRWDLSMSGGSLVAPLLIGVALGDLVHGLPIGANQEYAGNFWDLLTPYGLFVGVTFVVLCLFHGSTFMALKTEGRVRERSASLAGKFGIAAAAALAIFAVWTQLTIHQSVTALLISVVGFAAAVGATLLARKGREGRAFTATAVAMAATVLTIFASLYPRVMVSSLGSSNDLTIANTASSQYSLKLMTIVAVVFLPLVLLYQGWTYYVFRKRLRTTDLGDHAPTEQPEAAGTAD